jgi:hypothetical protein
MQIFFNKKKRWENLMGCMLACDGLRRHVTADVVTISLQQFKNPHQIIWKVFSMYQIIIFL